MYLALFILLYLYPFNAPILFFFLSTCFLPSSSSSSNLEQTLVSKLDIPISSKLGLNNQFVCNRRYLSNILTSADTWLTTWAKTTWCHCQTLRPQYSIIFTSKIPLDTHLSHNQHLLDPACQHTSSNLFSITYQLHLQIYSTSRIYQQLQHDYRYQQRSSNSSYAI